MGFDIESTGLETTTDEAISYGFAVYVEGQLHSTEEFFVLPDVQIHPGAERIHGVSYEHLRRRFREGSALSARAGSTRALSRLIELSNRGATFVGSNPMFDFSMLDYTLRRQRSMSLAASGFDLEVTTIIDVVARDDVGEISVALVEAAGQPERQGRRDRPRHRPHELARA